MASINVSYYECPRLDTFKCVRQYYIKQLSITENQDFTYLIFNKFIRGNTQITQSNTGSKINACHEVGCNNSQKTTNREGNEGTSIVSSNANQQDHTKDQKNTQQGHSDGPSYTFDLLAYSNLRRQVHTLKRTTNICSRIGCHCVVVYHLKKCGCVKI